MKPELEEKLFNKFGHLLGRGTTGGCAYIETGDGWYDLIDSLLSSIQSRVDSQRYLKESAEPTAVVVTQIKEKWGGLRVYLDGGDDFIWGVVHAGETMSHKICEMCGNPAVRRRSAWVMTLCDHHAALRLNPGADNKIDYEGGSNDRS